MMQVPVINLRAARSGSDRERRHVARQIDDACREIGFFTITAHGVPDHCGWGRTTQGQKEVVVWQRPH